MFWKTYTALVLTVSSFDSMYMPLDFYLILIILMHWKSFPNHNMYWRHCTLLNYTWFHSEGTKEKQDVRYCMKKFQNTRSF